MSLAEREAMMDDLQMRLMEREWVTGFGAMGPLTCEQSNREVAYEAMCEQRDRDYEEEQRTGRRQCPKCGNYSVKSTAIPTRQYGGGWDIVEKCERDDCDYADVFVGQPVPSKA